LDILEKLVKWENSNNPEVLEAARSEILKSTNGNPPPVLDPFCGGGSIPLEVQRLGLEAHASDLNPVAVLITKAMIEIPPKFKGQAPVNPEAKAKKQISAWFGAQGLAEDVRYYGKWIRDEAEKQIGHLYPKVKLPKEQGGGEVTVIAWLWARTVRCPNPTCGCQMPLVRSFELSTKKGKRAYVEPVVEHSQSPPLIQFEIKTVNGKALEGTVGRQGAACIACETPVTLDYIRAEGKAYRISAKLMAIVAEGDRGRIYLPPTEIQEGIATQSQPEWRPEVNLPEKALGFRVQAYGMRQWADLFTDRQLVALTTLSDLISKVQTKVQKDAVAAGLPDNDKPLNEGGTGAQAYADAIATYLAFAVDKLADYSSTICSWNAGRDGLRNTFARQAIPMTWDFAESNPFSSSTGNYEGAVNWIVGTLQNSPHLAVKPGLVRQKDATTPVDKYKHPLVFTTDPPYYDNIGYADLSDFFYVWLRRILSSIYPDLFVTLTTPKERELIYAPHRFDGNKEKAKQFFEEGLSQAFQQTYEASHPDYPFTVFYAFKQTETDKADDNSGLDGVASTGWETMLESLIHAGFSVTGTWPMRTEREGRTVASGSNALASSIALVCRPLPTDAPKVTRREFLNALKRELPIALHNLQQGNIAPVDFQQASIGPGMAVFSRYRAVLESDGSPMRVRTALQLINQTLDEFLSDQEGEFDADTRWALTWFEQHQFEEGLYGDAETLSKAKNTAVQGLVTAGILTAKSGKARLLRRDELPKTWNPSEDERIPDWEATQHLIHALDQKGETGAAKLLSQLNGQGEITRDLAYRLYSICDRKGWVQEAIAYNSLVISWPEISRLATQQTSIQGELVGV
jgi:putative DNA methylase